MLDFDKLLIRDTHLWILEKTPKGEYWRSHIISFPLIWDGIELKVCIFGRPITFWTCRDRKIVFIVNTKSGILCSCYDIMTNSWREIEIKGLPKESYIHQIYSYKDSLVPSAEFCN